MKLLHQSTLVFLSCLRFYLIFYTWRYLSFHPIGGCSGLFGYHVHNLSLRFVINIFFAGTRTMQKLNSWWHQWNRKTSQMCSVGHLVCGLYHKIYPWKINGYGFLWATKVKRPFFQEKFLPSLWIARTIILSWKFFNSKMLKKINLVD